MERLCHGGTAGQHGSPAGDRPRAHRVRVCCRSLLSLLVPQQGNPTDAPIRDTPCPYPSPADQLLGEVAKLLDRLAKGDGRMAVATKPAQKLTVDEVCAELQVARSTFYDWRQKGRGPRCIRLPNGSLRIRRADFENWLMDCEEVA